MITSDLSSLKATGKTKEISGVQAAEYEVKDENNAVRYLIWIDPTEKMPIYWYDMTLELLAENHVFNPIFFLNEGNVVLEFQEFEQGQAMYSMKATEMKKQVFTFDLRTYQRL